MNPHPAAQIFPPLVGEAFHELVEDIRRNGLLEPIVVLDGLILDGRTRMRACQIANVEPRFEEYGGTLGPIDYVRCKNLHRRHLTPSQRAAAAALAEKLLQSERELAARRRAQAKGRRRGEKASVLDGSPEQKGDARDRVGSAFGVSGRQVDRARRLRERDPGRFEAVKNGDQSVSAALREALRQDLAATFPTDERERVLTLIDGSDISDSTARKMASHLRDQPAQERRRIYSLHASRRPRDVRVARAKAMGLPPQPDPVLTQLSEWARSLKSYARSEFDGTSRVQLFEAADRIESVIRSEQEQLMKLQEPVFAGTRWRQNDRPAPRSVGPAGSTSRRVPLR